MRVFIKKFGIFPKKELTIGERSAKIVAYTAEISAKPILPLSALIIPRSTADCKREWPESANFAACVITAVGVRAAPEPQKRIQSYQLSVIINVSNTHP